MTDEKEITCIICPIGCKILVRLNGKDFEVTSGNKCIKGVEYARAEALDPKRMLTSSILVINGEWPLVSVKSSEPVPKNKLFHVLKEIKDAKVDAPVKLGQNIIKNVANTKINIIATKSIKRL
jgi:CxxC motif-containing protein